MQSELLEMFKLKIKKIKLFWIFVIIHALFALVIFMNELMAIYNRFPGGNYPIEHKSSWAKVLLFCSGAIISCAVMWVFDLKKRWATYLPPLWLVLVLAFFSTFLGIIFSHYLSIIGWCCEHPLSFYFGFPFSFLLGIGGFDYSLMKPYENYSLLMILSTSEPQVHWMFLPYEFFLDFLFCSNIILVLLSLVALFRKKDIQSEGNRVFSQATLNKARKER